MQCVTNWTEWHYLLAEEIKKWKPLVYFQKQINVWVSWEQEVTHFCGVLSPQQKFTVLFIIISSSQSWQTERIPQHSAGWVCLCRAHFLWMKWFVFLITASHPSPLCDMQINTPPSGICSLYPPLLCFLLLAPLVCCAHPTRILLLLLSLLLLLFPSSCSLSVSLHSPHLSLSHYRPLWSMPAGVSVFRSKYCHGSRSPGKTMGLTAVADGQGKSLGNPRLWLNG